MAKVYDYLYCEDCKQYVDLWKYGTVQDSGHERCKWRYVSKEELKESIEECKKNGCFNETIFGVDTPSQEVE